MSLRGCPPAPTDQGRAAPRRLRSGARVIVLLVALGITVGCHDRDPIPAPSDSAALASPTTTPVAADPRAGLLVLSGRVGAMRLVVFGSDGQPVAVDLPEPGVAWVSAGPGGLVLATTLDGRALLGRRAGPDGRLAWGPLRPSTLRGSATSHLTFGTIAADGAVAAFVDTDAASGPALLRIGLATDRTTALPLGGEPAGWPPVWLGSRLVVLRRLAGDRVAPAIVGEDGLTPWSGPGSTVAGAEVDPGGIGGSADGRLAAILDRGFGAVSIRPVTDGPGGLDQPGRDVPLAPLADGSTLVAWVALSPGGDRLAVVRADALGDALRVEIHAAAIGWGEVAGWALPAGADRAVVAWAP